MDLAVSIKDSGERNVASTGFIYWLCSLACSVKLVRMILARRLASSEELGARLANA